MLSEFYRTILPNGPACLVMIGGYIPRHLPYHPFAAEYGLPQTITIANKVGMLPGTINDAAIITTPSVSYALVIFTRDCRDNRPDPDNEGALLVAQLSKRICDYIML